MARSKFTFNEKALKRVANEAGRKIAARLSTMLNGMSSEFAGRPVEEIKPVLQSRWRAVADGSITDPQLTEYAERISAGTTFNVTVDELS
ncbi:hypothetical protein [Streptomyces sp. NPDC018055]|uniref:hypothetical protein n=1 Tax=Streptomyces sp. NPDC018055 TaxID=3365038 RepID=UPI0037A78890